ncbi:MAG: hypothetical protein JNL08_13490 [Planctomycetes bacterium]|nr:hypothetical protein [Planctomycetota bacterium]
MPRRLLPTASCLTSLLLTAGCASESSFGLVLERGTQTTIEVHGSAPFVRVDNDGPGVIDAHFAPTTDAAGTERILRGSVARTLRGGGRLQFVLVDGDRAVVQVLVQRASGCRLLRQDRPPSGP